MAIVAKMNRCALCGSTHVNAVENGYRCMTCGKTAPELMNAADAALIDKAALGGENEALQTLRKRYPHLDLPTWSSKDRLQR